MLQYNKPILGNPLWSSEWFAAPPPSSGTTIRISGKDVTSILPQYSAVRVIKNGTTIYDHVFSSTFTGGNTDIVLYNTSFTLGDVVSLNPSHVKSNESLGFRVPHVVVEGTKGALIKGPDPLVEYYETDAGANEKRWRFHIDSGVFKLSLTPDGSDTETDILSLDRSGATKLTLIEIKNTDLIRFTNEAARIAFRPVSGSSTAVHGNAFESSGGSSLWYVGNQPSSGDWGVYDSVNARWGLRVHAGTSNNGLTYLGHVVWHQNNDGTGSGLDADLLDGYHASALAVLAENETIQGLWKFSRSTTAIMQMEKTGGNTDPHRFQDLSGVGFSFYDNVAATELLQVTNGTFQYKGNTIWHSNNDGTGSGLDADTVDGQHASAFSLSGHNHDSRYYTEGEVDGFLDGKVSVAGDTMTGVLTLQPSTSQKLVLKPDDSLEDNQIQSHNESGATLWVLNLADRDQANRFGLFSQFTGSYVFYVNAGGNATFTGDLYANKHITTSSRKLKKDIQYVDLYDESILNLRPVKFRRKGSKSSAYEYGLTAEDSDKICKLITHYNDKGEPDGIDYLLLSLMQNSHIKKQRSIIEEQGRRIEALESKLKIR